MSLVSSPSSRGEHKRPSTWKELESSRPLPVRFQLYASRRTNKALCPCLIVRSRGISVIRILDPEHKQPYITLDSIFLLSNRTIPDGILEFDLSRESGHYDLTLAGLEPREALWAPLKLAREMAEQVGLLGPLATLLDWDNRHIWSLDEGEAGLVHNWRALQLDADSYSTGLLIQTEMKEVTLLPRGQQVRTLLSQEQRQSASDRLSTMIDPPSHSRSKYEQRLLRWSVLACEELLRSQRGLESHSADNEEEDEERHFNLESSDILLLFGDFLDSMHLDPKFKYVSVESEELLARQEAAASSKLSKDEAYRRARINVILIHHLWTLTMSQIKADHTSASLQEDHGPLVESGESELNNRIKRIEAACKRSEWAVSELLTRKASAPSVSHDPQQDSWQLPYFGIMDSRFLVTLLVGVLLGSMTSRM